MGCLLMSKTSTCQIDINVEKGLDLGSMSLYIRGVIPKMALKGIEYG